MTLEKTKEELTSLGLDYSSYIKGIFEERSQDTESEKDIADLQAGIEGMICGIEISRWCSKSSLDYAKQIAPVRSNRAFEQVRDNLKKHECKSERILEYILKYEVTSNRYFLTNLRTYALMSDIEKVISRKFRGAPKKENKKIQVGIKLPPALIKWLDEQEDSRALVIESACRKIGFDD